MSTQVEPKCVINIKLTSPVIREEVVEESGEGLYFLFGNICDDKSLDAKGALTLWGK